MLPMLFKNSVVHFLQTLSTCPTLDTVENHHCSLPELMLLWPLEVHTLAISSQYTTPIFILATTLKVSQVLVLQKFHPVKCGACHQGCHFCRQKLVFAICRFKLFFFYWQKLAKNWQELETNN